MSKKNIDFLFLLLTSRAALTPSSSESYSASVSMSSTILEATVRRRARSATRNAIHSTRPVGDTAAADHARTSKPKHNRKKRVKLKNGGVLCGPGRCIGPFQSISFIAKTRDTLCSTARTTNTKFKSS